MKHNLTARASKCVRVRTCVCSEQVSLVVIFPSLPSTNVIYPSPAKARSHDDTPCTFESDDSREQNHSSVTFLPAEGRMKIKSQLGGKKKISTNP